MKTTERMECVTCKGQGRMEQHLDYAGDPTGPRCETCKGHGYMLQEVTRTEYRGPLRLNKGLVWS